jgi:hypothetical protein
MRQCLIYGRVLRTGLYVTSPRFLTHKPSARSGLSTTIPHAKKRTNANAQYAALPGLGKKRELFFLGIFRPSGTILLS